MEQYNLLAEEACRKMQEELLEQIEEEEIVNRAVARAERYIRYYLDEYTKGIVEEKSFQTAMNVLIRNVKLEAFLRDRSQKRKKEAY